MEQALFVDRAGIDIVDQRRPGAETGDAVADAPGVWDAGDACAEAVALGVAAAPLPVGDSVAARVDLPMAPAALAIAAANSGSIIAAAHRWQ